MLHDDLTAPLIGAFYDVHHELGHGFLESVYERAMIVALSRRGIPVERQVPVTVRYGGHVVGEFCAPPAGAAGQREVATAVGE